jgi:hypothetical protein
MHPTVSPSFVGFDPHQGRADLAVRLGLAEQRGDTWPAHELDRVRELLRALRPPVDVGNLVV